MDISDIVSRHYSGNACSEIPEAAHPIKKLDPKLTAPLTMQQTKERKKVLASKKTKRQQQLQTYRERTKFKIASRNCILHLETFIRKSRRTGNFANKTTRTAEVARSHFCSVNSRLVHCFSMFILLALLNVLLL